MILKHALSMALATIGLGFVASAPDEYSSVYPKDFAWGAATAAYQIEGAWNEGGREPSIWDTFSQTPGRTANGDTGNVAIDSYHRYKEDIDLAHEMGITHYRMSISWPRILPTGDLPVNQEGVDFYNDVINYVLSKGVTPFVTLYHWDLPQTLEDEFNGWLDEKSIDKFDLYAKTCFEAFGDRVKNWLTFNEPLTFCNLGYQIGMHAPGRCSDRGKCPAGNSDTEPYIVGHNVLRSHAKAVKTYRDLKQANSSILPGEIGITLNCDWREPVSDSEGDKRAANEQIESQLSWFADPVFFGKYPDSMVRSLGDRLPKFTEEESNLIKGSWDFFGLNHYTSLYAGQGFTSPNKPGGGLIGPQADSSWLYVVPWGFNKLLKWVSDRYANPGIFVTENGCDVPNESSLSLDQALNDQFRVDFYKGYIGAMAKAMKDGVKVRGYFAWSLLDNFEWADGYNKRFGMHYVDYKNDLKRYPKESSKWYKSYIADHGGSRTDSINGATQDAAAAPANKAIVETEPEIVTTKNVAATTPEKKASGMKNTTSLVAGLVGVAAAVALVTAFFVGRHYRKARRQPTSSDVELRDVEEQQP